MNCWLFSDLNTACVYGDCCHLFGSVDYIEHSTLCEKKRKY